MRILVTKTTRAAPDGITVRRYRAGETAEMPEDLARVFLREGWGREADGTARGLDASGPGLPDPNQPQTNGVRRTKRRRRRKRGGRRQADRAREPKA